MPNRLAKYRDVLGYFFLASVLAVACLLRKEQQFSSQASVALTVQEPEPTRHEGLRSRLMREASAGDIVSQRQLGQSFLLGLDGERSETHAATWFMKSAQKGDATAAYLLGNCYNEGRGVVMDQSQAARWWGVASLGGNDDAACMLAFARLKGKGVEMSPGEGVSLLLRAAERGHSIAQFNVGLFHFEGHHLSKSYSDAFSWFRRSAVQGNPRAQSFVGLMYRDGLSVPLDYDQALLWLGFAIEKKESSAFYHLAEMHRDGLGIPKNDSKASELFLRSANLGHVLSQLEIGTRYASGTGVTQDLVEGCAWFEVASSADARFASSRDHMFSRLSASRRIQARSRAESIRREIDAIRKAEKAP